MRKKIGWLFLVLLVAAGIVVGIPQLRERVFAQIDDIRIQIRSVLFPVTEQAFVPNRVILPTVTVARDDLIASPTPIPATAEPTLTLTPLIPQPTEPPTATATALPVSVSLKGVKWETQNGAWNYCGPTNLAMLLSYWGWKGDKFTTGHYLKPFDYDYNVMPYEMLNYIQDQTNLGAVMRLGGTLSLLKRLIANGYPVLVEKGVDFPETATHQLGWMGHYTVLTGFDDQKKQFITQDSYIQPDLPVAYDTLEQEWRAFDFVFVVAFSQDKKDSLYAVLGDYADENKSFQIALKRASDEINALTGMDQYFAWFNRGTSLVDLQDFAGAADSFDKAFQIYPSLPEATRPWRMLWYQTGPYFAYFYSGRYQDVVDLATTTLDFIKNRAERLGISTQPQVGQFIEETWYWRAKARLVIGDRTGAISDLKTALKYHPGFIPAVDELNGLGVPVN
jgi:tetratricopeptide (TPR) repeat protein